MKKEQLEQINFKIRAIESEISLGHATEQSMADLVFLYNVKDAGKKNVKQKADAAISFIKKEMEIRGENPQSYLLLARVHMILKEKESASIYYDKALALNPDFKDALDDKIRFNLIAPENKLSTLNKLIEENPYEVKFYRNRAEIKMENEDFDSAIIDLQKIMDLSDKDYDKRYAQDMIALAQKQKQYQESRQNENLEQIPTRDTEEEIRIARQNLAQKRKIGWIVLIVYNISLSHS